MKEYKTINVKPEEEETAIRYHETFGWKLEETREVYNESQEIVGVNEKVTLYGDGIVGSFMRGFTGNDGKVETQVQTRTNVTHFLSMRFSRETGMKNYQRLSELQEEFDGTDYLSYARVPRKPIALTVIASIALAIVLISLMQLFFGEKAAVWEIVVCVIVPIAAVLTLVLSWVLYKKKKKRAVEVNTEISQRNEEIRAHIDSIIEEAQALVEDNNAA